MTTSNYVKSSPSRDSAENREEARMSSLYAPFRLKSLNPEGWESKMNFWCDSISRRCAEKKNPTFTIDDLKAEFIRKNKTPACIDTVVEDLIRFPIQIEMFRIPFWNLTKDRSKTQFLFQLKKSLSDRSNF